jgi:hypothetical protein
MATQNHTKFHSRHLLNQRTIFHWSVTHQILSFTQTQNVQILNDMYKSVQSSNISSTSHSPSHNKQSQQCPNIGPIYTQMQLHTTFHFTFSCRLRAGIDQLTRQKRRVLSLTRTLTHWRLRHRRRARSVVAKEMQVDSHYMLMWVC